MSDDNRIVQAAQFLLEEHRTRKPFGPIPASCAAHTVDEAYAVQEALHALMAARAYAEIRVIVVFHGFAFRPAGAQPGAEPYDLAASVNVPMLILHGTEDERAPIADRFVHRDAEPCIVMQAWPSSANLMCMG